MSAGRIESYIHSDKTTPNKGGVLAKVSSQTDFAAKTDEFIAFCKEVARTAYAYCSPEPHHSSATLTGDEFFDELEAIDKEAADALEAARADLAAKLRERVIVEEIVILKL